MMNDLCGLCRNKLSSMDTMLGENLLSDGNILCNACLEKASLINEELLSDLHRFSLKDIEKLLGKGTDFHKENTQENTTENFTPVVHTEQNVLSKDVYKKRLKEIKRQLESLNANLSVFTKGEIKELPNILDFDEAILAITDAQFIKTTDAGILLATQKRIISVSKAMFSPAKVNEYSNDDITEVSFIKKLLSPIIRIHTVDKIVEFESFFNNDYAEEFYNLIEKMYNREKVENQLLEAQEAASENVFEQLEKLARLRETGILTEQEFTEQKKKLLEKL